MALRTLRIVLPALQTYGARRVVLQASHSSKVMRVEQVRFYALDINKVKKLPAESSSVHDAEAVEVTDEKKAEDSQSSSSGPTESPQGSGEEQSKPNQEEQQPSKSRYEIPRSGFTIPERKLTLKTAIKLLQGELVALPILVCLIATLYLLSQNRKEKEDDIRKIERRLLRVTDRANGVIESQLEVWNKNKDELLKDIPAQKKQLIESFVVEKIIRDHSLPEDDSLFSEKETLESAPEGEVKKKAITLF